MLQLKFPILAGALQPRTTPLQHAPPFISSLYCKKIQVRLGTSIQRHIESFTLHLYCPQFVREMPEFHAKFSSAELEFRILKVCSRSFSIAAASAGQSVPAADVPIYCELYHKFHEEKPYYEALSYTW